MEKTQEKTFLEQIHDYYHLTGAAEDENLDSIFSGEKKPDLVLSSRDETVVALQYIREKMDAPAIRIKGKNEFAKKIVSRAEKNKIPIVEKNELTRELYAQVSTDDLLPMVFWEKAARIYAKIFANDDGLDDAAGDDTNQDKAPLPVCIPDKVALELGSDLMPLVTYSPLPLSERIKNSRRSFFLEMGFEFPAIRIVENLNLKEAEYAIKVNGVEAGRACINMYLTINTKNSSKKIAGEKTRDPVFGISALWIGEDEIKKAKKAGYGVFDPVTVIVTHISEIIKSFSTELVGLDEIQGFINCVKEKYPVVVKEVLKYYSLGDIKKVIHGLLEERVSIKNIPAIFETLSDYGEQFAHNHEFLIEKVRQKLGRQICAQYLDDENTLWGLELEADMERKIIEAGIETTEGRVLVLEPADQSLWISELSKNLRKMAQAGFSPVILCSEAARRLIKSSTKRNFPELAVLSVLEIAEGIHVKSAGTINTTKVTFPKTEVLEKPQVL
jgi:flagellar biosynthesis protein FlhA